MKILYLENHEIFAKTVVSQFLSAHRVVTAPSLAQARRALAENGYELLLVDYDLDDGKGAEIIEEVRRAFPKLAIIGVSAHRAGNEALLKAGADAICSKMEFDNIQKVMEKAMSLRGS